MEKIHGFQVIFFSIPIRIVLCQMQPEAQKRNIMNVGVLSTYKYHVPNHFVKILKQLLTLQNWHAEVLMNQITYLLRSWLSRIAYFENNWPNLSSHLEIVILEHSSFFTHYLTRKNPLFLKITSSRWQEEGNHLPKLVSQLVVNA